MLKLTGFLGLTRIPLGFWAHTDLTDPTLLLCGWEISQMLLRVGWLARIPLCFWAHTDLTDPTVLLCGWEISQMLLWVGNLTDGSVGVGSWGAARGSLSRTYLLDPSDKSDLSDKSDGLDIFKNNPSGICVRPPWDWDLCEASVDSVWAGDKITKNCVIWGAF